MKKCLIVVMILMMLGTMTMFGAETLEQILAKNYEAKGGLEKIKAIKTMTFEGKMIQMSMELPIKGALKMPNKMRADVAFQDKKIVMAYDGETAWWIMPPMGITEPTEQAKEAAEDTKEQAEAFFPLVNYKKYGHKLELVGTEDMEGTEVYKLKMTKKNGKEVFFYLDCETGIDLKTAFYKKKEANEVLIETLLGDYKEVDGIMIAFQTDTKANGQPTGSMIFTSAKFNEKIDDSFFKMPAKTEKK
ncbi:MAG: outer membrane lipoprotein-sorting protein [bacterium]|nr:outer membrane lipoprotein-sorting protein [bacterium]